MGKSDLGKKLTCPSCGARFYDLNRTPAVCPKCDAEVEAKPLLKPKRPAPEPAKPAKPAPEKAADDGDDDDLAEDDEDLEIEDDEDLIEDTSDLEEDEDDVSEVKEHIEVDNDDT